MANVLEKIVEDKRQELIALKASLPLDKVRANLTPSERSFYDALAQQHSGYIFECKKASPSKGLIRENFNLDEIITAYKPHAACISVLTDEKYFQGSFDYLRYVRERVSQPVLNKDFFCDPYQVYLARYHNADAILLMLSVLDDEQYIEMAEIAESLRLDVLTEVSNLEETQRAIRLKARIIGINNRNLRDLSTDLATTEQLAPMIKASGHECLIISESGIYTHQDIRRLAPLADGFLVGSALMAQENLAQAVKDLVYGAVKVCGITRPRDAKSVASMPVSFMGLIFAPASERAISLEQAQDIVAAVPFNYVGVFVNAPERQVAEYAAALGLAAVQLHGREDQQYIDTLRPLLPDGCEIWLARGIVDNLPAMDEKQVDRFLLDCKVGNKTGGTGQSFDWRLLDGLQDRKDLVLAGGINADNIVGARQRTAGVLDLNSGVESSPGIKDMNKLKQAFVALRSY
ncbi:bifunctional indole-3-glycerol-phosphate synthase TrpC/phosphoribosylanthranilate isomerase TrpF [Aestuariibacter salexigens]|uniref:bifunctional indole-3-glycerol-phosphate synthase TrpC/phosphoribosylanthranilate isomerase TrpF n=1 Tax=Aestuariibacter salexigens TaxID=226010 RepID=UPI0004251512|nr:bifunctional indole-3-glycerol-phosphate synthase TrpC/phosphoribosylanthranilate isomerase TrpF [Aestuariibacter salexigens]